MVWIFTIPLRREFCWLKVALLVLSVIDFLDKWPRWMSSVFALRRIAKQIAIDSSKTDIHFSWLKFVTWLTDGRHRFSNTTDGFWSQTLENSFSSSILKTCPAYGRCLHHVPHDVTSSSAGSLTIVKSQTDESPRPETRVFIEHKLQRVFRDAFFFFFFKIWNCRLLDYAKQRCVFRLFHTETNEAVLGFDWSAASLFAVVILWILLIQLCSDLEFVRRRSVSSFRALGFISDAIWTSRCLVTSRS